MKVTFEFDTEKDDIFAINQHIYAEKTAQCLNDLRGKIRSLVKYSDKETITIDELDDGFWEIIKDNGITFEDLVGY